MGVMKYFICVLPFVACVIAGAYGKLATGDVISDLAKFFLVLVLEIVLSRICFEEEYKNR